MLKITAKEIHILFGKFIRDVREAENLYQWEIAERMGVTQSYLSYIERGERDLDLGDAFEMCDKLGVNMEIFIRKYINGEEDVEIVIAKEEA